MLGEFVTAVLAVLLKASEFLTSGTGDTAVSRSHLAAFAVETDFAHLALSRVTGLRIWRIVVDPQLRGRGLGSLVVTQFVKCLEGTNLSSLSFPFLEAKEPILDSASFDLTFPLLRFWTWQGFLVAEMSSVPNWSAPARPQLSRKRCSDLDQNFGKRFFMQLSDFQDFSVDLCLDLLEDAMPGFETLWRPSLAVQLERLAGSQDPLLHVAQSRPCLSEVAEAFFMGRLEPMHFVHQDREVILSLGMSRDVASIPARPGEAQNLTALRIKRIAREVALRIGLSIGKEVLIVSEELSRWLLWRETPADVRLGNESLGVSWTYPVEDAGGELAFSLSPGVSIS